MLPYQTLEDATLALGRNLTFTETLWFDYSSRKSDYFLHCHNLFLSVVVYTLVPLPWVLIDLVRPAKLEKYKIQPMVRLSFSDMLSCYKDVMKVYMVLSPPIALISFKFMKENGIRTGLPLPSLSEILLQILVYFLVEDYVNYWIHRWFHSNKWAYSKIHRIHHEFTAPIGFASSRVHWFEVVASGLPSFLGPTIVPCHIVTLWLWIALRYVETIEIHSGYDLPWNPTKLIPFYGGAVFHDSHHKVRGQSNGNFASVFTYCDFIYGTHKGYSYHKKLKSGHHE